jgi:hypothetical protein
MLTKLNSPFFIPFGNVLPKKSAIPFIRQQLQLNSFFIQNPSLLHILLATQETPITLNLFNQELLQVIQHNKY